MSTLSDHPEHPRVTLHETVYRGAVWDVVRDTFDYRSGQLRRDYVNHPGASAVVAVTEDREVVLLRQYRHPVRSRNWELPAGLLDVVGEDPVECAKRELAEEAGLSADRFTPLLSLNVSPGGSNEVIHIFLAEGLHEVGTDFVKEGEEEDLEVHRWPLDEAVKACLDGRIRNQIAVTGLLAAHARLP